MSSEDSDDDFVTFGTPLEPLDEAAMPRKKAFTLQDQVARDNQGRRRFHGAFTGGFSAGFMNTAGSLEGWKPAQFKSSREERGGKWEQKPEDFMDDEDTGEFGIAPSRLAAKADFADSASKRKRATPSFNDGPIPGTPVLQQLLQNVRETVGVRLLKGMGWKPGQGVGPRVDSKTRRAERRKMYGCEPPPQDSYGFEPESVDSESDDDLDLADLTFAPLDIQPYIAHPKKDGFGLGYSGLDRHSVLGSVNVASGLKYADKKGKVNIRGQAFGVGAFEEEDEDIYSKEDMSQYDFTMGEEQSKTPRAQLNTPGVVPGFILAKHKVVKKMYPPPPLPPGFCARHEARKSRFAPAPKSTESSATKTPGLGRHDVSAQVRGVMLNDPSDQPLVKATADESRVEPVRIAPTNTTLTTTPFQSGQEITHQSHLTSSGYQISDAGQNNQLPVEGRFKPFLFDPHKQRRYEQYLAMADKGMLCSLQPVTLSPWERERERREFEQAALIYKPLAGIMEDRFMTAQQPDEINNPLAVVEKVQHGDETKRNAAKMKMFGTLTREESSWAPCSLLCKRFNVPEPGTCRSAVDTKKKSKYSIFDSLDSLVKKEPLETPSVPTTTRRIDVAEEGIVVELDRPQTSYLESAAEPLFVDPATKVDLFKAIFLDSSDEEADESNERMAFEKPIKNVDRNTSPQRGIFANIDLEALSSRRSVGGISALPPQPVASLPVTTQTLPPQVSPPSRISGSSFSPACDDGMYGPKIPDRLVACATAQETNSSSEEEWEEKNKKTIRKHKKNKKHKKHKSKKHKKKHKR